MGLGADVIPWRCICSSLRRLTVNHTVNTVFAIIACCTIILYTTYILPYYQSFLLFKIFIFIKITIRIKKTYILLFITFSHIWKWTCMWSKLVKGLPKVFYIQRPTCLNHFFDSVINVQVFLMESFGVQHF